MLKPTNRNYSGKWVEAPGIEPGSENFFLMPLRAYPTNCIAASCAHGQALLVASPLFDFRVAPGGPVVS